MRALILSIVFVLLGLAASAFGNGEEFFHSLSNYNFDQARSFAQQEEDSALRHSMLELVDILYHEGQISRDPFKDTNFTTGGDLAHIVGDLRQGYLSLFYDHTKLQAYEKFHSAYERAVDAGNRVWINACLYALLRYYNSQVEQDKDYHLPYIQQLERYQSNATDRFWVTIFKMVFFTKQIGSTPDEYFKLSATLDEFEQSLDSNSPLRVFLYYEKAIHKEVLGDQKSAADYFVKAIRAAGTAPYVRQQRFNADLHLMLILSRQGKIDSARGYFASARKETARYDTLRSQYALNAYASLFMKDLKKYDSAFLFLWAATQQDLQLRARATTLEINRLNVELDTREKENANLQLKQDRVWLIAGLVAAALLLAVGYFAYLSQRSRVKLQLQEKEVQAMKLEKQLKDQEVLGIDLMIEGQEKERQRIANDLHDDLGGQLAAIKIKLEGLQRLSTKQDQSDLLHHTTDLLNEAYQKVRSMAHARNAGINAQEGLLPAVRNFAAKVSTANRLAIQVEEHGMDSRLENSLEIAIFRVIQELITNVIKHSQATEAFIHLTQHEQSINVMVEDNGIGFDRTKIKPGNTMGLYSIQKRIENLGGSVTIEPIPEKGTSVIIDIPLA